MINNGDYILTVNDNVINGEYNSTIRFGIDWNDNDGTAAPRPPYVTISSQYGISVQLDSSNNWAAELNLPIYSDMLLEEQINYNWTINDVPHSTVMQVVQNETDVIFVMAPKTPTPPKNKE